MDASLYSVMSAAKQYGYMHEVNTNNVANANTNGFKQDNVSFKALYLNGGNTISTSSYTELNNISIDLRAGSLAHTGRAEDIAVSGNGFFELMDSEGVKYYKRSLTVMKNIDGILVNADGGKILDQSGGTIDVGHAPFKTDSAGNIVTFNGEVTQVNGQLKVVEFNSQSAFKLPSGQISIDPEVPPIPAKNYAIAQGYQESSNVNSVEAMGELINSQKNYELATKTMSTLKTLHKSSNSILE